MHWVSIVSFMTSERKTAEIAPLIRSLYPNGSDQELREAQQGLIEYVAVVLRIFDRLERERQGDSRDDTDRSRIGVD
jgi:hypothetical protein